jgi:hypothetical protein
MIPDIDIEKATNLLKTFNNPNLSQLEVLDNIQAALKNRNGVWGFINEVVIGTLLMFGAPQADSVLKILLTFIQVLDESHDIELAALIRQLELEKENQIEENVDLSDTPWDQLFKEQ